MASHRDVYTDAQWAQLRLAPIAAIYRISLATLSVAADLAHEFLAADDALNKFARSRTMTSLVTELFSERLVAFDLKIMVARHCSAYQSLDLVMNAARLVQTHHPDAADSYTDAVMTAARAAANAVKEISIPGFGRATEAEETAMYEINEALHCHAQPIKRTHDFSEAILPSRAGTNTYGPRSNH